MRGDSAETTEERLQRLEDLEEIRRLFADYKRTLDGKDFAAYAELFAGGGEFVAGELRAKGRAEIQALVEGMLGNLLTAERGDDFHVVANPSLTVDGDRARSELVWLYIVRGEGDSPVLAKYGHYEDELVREDGRWRFLRRQAPTDIPAV
jgi:uncharacterized protein (TIGR02246 family)